MTNTTSVSTRTVRPRVFIQEVAPRDGLQNEPVFVPTDAKVALVDALSLTGVSRIEVTSFVSPKAIPALADAAEVMRAVRRAPGVAYAALVPNPKGAERALDCGVDEFNLVMSASGTHNRANLRMTREASFDALSRVVALAHDADAAVNVSLSCAFGCPFEGDVPQDEVLGWAARFADLGVRGLTLCDTTGMAHPAQVAALCGAALARFPEQELTLHGHDTRGMGLANVLAALQAGVHRFDASLGGLGGCPYAPGASGNTCTEDMVHMLDLMGLDTGVDLPALLDCARGLEALVGRRPPGALLRAGRRLDLHAPPVSLQAA